MDGPGLSIFHGSDLKFSNSFQRAEEDELEEENRKREAELKDLFQDAFDDLHDEDDDDASSIASSQLSANQSDHEFRGMKNFNFAPILTDFRDLPSYHQPIRNDKHLETIPEKNNESNDSITVYNHQKNLDNDVSGQHYTHCFKNVVAKDRDTELMEKYKTTEGGGYDELKVLYEVRMREVDRLRKEVDVEREAKEEAIHRLALCQSEKDKALSEVSERQQLILKSKDHISELESSIESMKLEILQLEKNREKDREEVEISHQQVICLEQKIAALERCDTATIRMKQMDAFIENLSMKHQKEITILQNKLDATINKLEQKDCEIRALETKLDEVERKRAALVLEKCDGAARQENALQALLSKANDEKIELNRQIVALQSECTGLKSELDQYESVAKLRLCLGSSSDESSELPRAGPSQLTRTKSVSSLPKTSQINPHYQDLISNLRDELHRALLAKAAKRHEINKLQEQVRSKELQLQEMKERERVYLSQVDSLKTDISKIVGQLSETKSGDQSSIIEQMKSEVDKLDQMNQQHIVTINDLNSEIIRLKVELKSEYSSKVIQGENFVDLRDNELAQLKQQTDQMMKAKEIEWKSKFEVLMKECDEIKQLYMNLRKNNGRLIDQLEFHKKQVSSLNKEKEQIFNILKDKEDLVDKLKEENIKYKVEKELIANNNCSDPNSQGKNTIRALELEVEKLRNELVSLPKHQTKELEALKNELEGAKQRLLDLDSRLRKDFENEVSNLISERDSLKETLKQKEDLLKQQSSNTTSLNYNGAASELFNNEIKNLKEEIEILKVGNTDEDYEKKLVCELEDLEKRLVSEHKTELVATEERIKHIMVSYYSNHIEEIKKQFEVEFTKNIAVEMKKISELTQMLAQKETEIQQLKSCESSEKIVALQKKLEEDRQKFTETIKHWSNQVESLRKKITDDENKIHYLNQSLKTERKDAQKYKAKFDNAKRRIQQEKLENMLKIKADLDHLRDLSDIDCKKLNEKIKLVEFEFNERERTLKLQRDTNRAIDD